MASVRLSDDPNLTTVLAELVDNIIDSCLMDGILVMHRAIKLGYFNVIAPDPLDESTEVQTVGSSNRDAATKAASCCRCVKCHCKVAATRFAPHLSNCMGLGRNSSRRANKRIAEQQRLEDFGEDDYEYVDETTAVVVNISSFGPNIVPAASSLSNGNSALEPTTGSRCPEAGALPVAAISGVSTSNSGNSNSKQHSPLKMTISLVPLSGKSETRQHVARPIGEQMTIPFCPSTNSRVRTGGGSASAKLLSSKTPVILKEAVIPLVHHPQSVRSDEAPP